MCVSERVAVAEVGRPRAGSGCRGLCHTCCTLAALRGASAGPWLSWCEIPKEKGSHSSQQVLAKPSAPDCLERCWWRVWTHQLPAQPHWGGFAETNPVGLQHPSARCHPSQLAGGTCGCQPQPMVGQRLPRPLPHLQRWALGLFPSPPSRRWHHPTRQGSPIAVLGTPLWPSRRSRSLFADPAGGCSLGWCWEMHPGVFPLPTAAARSRRHPGWSWLSGGAWAVGPHARGCLCGTAPGSQPRQGSWMAAPPKAVGCSRPQGVCRTSCGFPQAAPH